MDLAEGRYEHGTATCYRKAKCRCEPCRGAERQRQQELKRRRPEMTQEARDRARAWRVANRDRHRSYSRSWRSENLDQARAADQAYYLANRERLLEYQRTYQRINPMSPERRRAIKSRRRQAVLAQMDALDRALSVAYRSAIKNDACGYCGDPGEQDDHVHPLSRGGTDHWWNLVRSCTPCNQSKGAKLLEEWPGRPELLRQLDLDPQIAGASAGDVDVGCQVLAVGQGRD